MSDDNVNPEEWWCVTTKFMREAAEDNKKRRKLEAIIERVRAMCENDLRWIDAQNILRALDGDVP